VVRSTLASAYDPARNNFDFLRFVLAAAVLWTHSYSLAGAVDPIGRLSAQLDVGRLAVDGFFVISGFLVTQSWRRSATVATFARKRALRLLPALVVALAVSALVIGPFVARCSVADYFAWSRPWLVFAGVLLHRFLTVPGTFSSNVFYDHVNASVWTLRYEFACYVLVAAVGALAARARLVALAAVFAIAWLGGQQALPGGERHWLPHFAAYFVAGMLLYELRASVPFTRWSVLLAVGGVSAGLAAGRLDAVGPVFGSYLLLACALSSRLPVADFGRRGDFSYGLYLYAYPIQQLVLYVSGGHASPLLVLGVAFPLTLAVAVLSWRWVEEPALALKHRPAGSTGRPSLPQDAGRAA
jgi:peptidoglycan/LPS O-acetylase OafA/YrhL